MMSSRPFSINIQVSVPFPLLSLTPPSEETAYLTSWIEPRCLIFIVLVFKVDRPVLSGFKGNLRTKRRMKFNRFRIGGDLIRLRLAAIIRKMTCRLHFIKRLRSLGVSFKSSCRMYSCAPRAGPVIVSMALPLRGRPAS